MFFELDPAEMPKYLFLSQFKMAMSPSLRGGAPLNERTVLGEGANVPVLLRTAVAKVLDYIRLEAVDRAASIGLTSAESLSWVITVPAIWDEQAKAFMRECAVEAGIISDVNSSRLALALEPEGAVIASSLEAPEEVKAKLQVGERLLIVDAGGGTVDCTVSELVGQNPPRLREILPPSGGPWGGTMVDAQFRALCADMLMPQGGTGGAEGGSHEDASAAASALDAWEAAKCGWDPSGAAGGGGREKIIVSGLATVCEYLGGPEVVAQRVAAYNSKHSLEGPAAVVYRPRSFSLVLPPGVVTKLFDACVLPICAHMQNLLSSAAELGKGVGFVFLVGGFAESLYLQNCVREALLTEDGPIATLIIPAKPVQCVNRGAAVWGLYPSTFITSRIAMATFAVSLCERYNPAVHNPLPHDSYLIENKEGKWVDNVLVCVAWVNMFFCLTPPPPPPPSLSHTRGPPPSLSPTPPYLLLQAPGAKGGRCPCGFQCRASGEPREGGPGKR
jgi:hypothetical protein